MSTEGIRIRTTRSEPCIFCGDVGYDMKIVYSNEDTVYWCHKVKAAQNDIVHANGNDYICISSKKQIKIGEFYLFKKYIPKEEWLAIKKKKGEWYKKSGKSNDYSFEKKVPTDTNSEPISNKELDIRYRYLLSLLVLEDSHQEQLKEEWNAGIYSDLAERLLKRYPIRSLPPLDKVRYSGNMQLRNISRKKVVKAMYDKFGSLKGIPGFYMRSGKYWNEQPDHERWTIVSIEGILFPCYDKNGYLYRLRIRDDYPDMRIKPNSNVLFRNERGILTHCYRNGDHNWYWCPDSSKDQEPILVYENGRGEIELNKWGLPTIGKPNGKYKNISSVYEKLVGDKIVNTMLHGTRSGSPYSLYVGDAKSYRIVIGTEGEKKGMVSNSIKNVPVVSQPGVWSFRSLFEPGEDGVSLIKTLMKRGMEIFILCYDADKHTNENVSNAEAAFIQALFDEGVRPMTGEWSDKFDKGLDDILIMGVDFKLFECKK